MNIQIPERRETIDQFIDEQVVKKNFVSLRSVVKCCNSGTVAGEVSGMSRGTQDTVPGCPGLPDQRDVAEVPGVAHRDYRRASRPDEWSGHGEVQRLLGEVLLLHVRPLREEDLFRLQGGAHGHSAP